MNIPHEEMPRKIEELLGDIEKLEEENKILKRNCNIGNEELNFYRKEYKKLKSVLDEIKTHVEEYGTGELKFVFGVCILKILDKVNNER